MLPQHNLLRTWSLAADTLLVPTAASVKSATTKGGDWDSESVVVVAGSAVAEGRRPGFAFDGTTGALMILASAKLGQ